MSEKSVAWPESNARPERDTLPSIEHEFLRDQLKALLSSQTLHHDADGSAHEESDIDESDTEPSADARLLRDAILAAGKSA